MEKDSNLTNKEIDMKDEAEIFKEEYENSDEISKMTLIIDQLKNENRNIRYFCINNLNTVAELLGPSRTEEELLPLILDYIINFEDNEEILSKLTLKLFELTNFISNKNNITSILRGLELLAGNDDENVRQNATDNLCKLIRISDDKIIQNEVFPLMQRLIQNDIKSKISCCYLFPLVYQKLNCENTKQELFQVFNEISREDSPSVRRAAAANIGELALVGDNNLLNSILNLHFNLLKDNVDIVKVHAIESTKTLLEQSDEEQKKTLINNFISSINRDKSWRVKYAAAETICDVVKNFDFTFNELNFLPSMMLFLKDTEPEVRSSAIAKINILINNISKEKFVLNIIPILQEMINDSNHHVRSLLATSLLKICENVDENVFQNNMEELINKIIKDETLEVKNAAVAGFDKLINFIKNKSICEKHILPMMVEISKESKWRVRFTLCEKLNSICDNLDIETFKKNFLNLLTIFFMDHAYEIRNMTIQIFNKFLEKDLEENKSVIWEKIKTSLLSNNYILRIEGLKAIDSLKHHFYKSTRSSNTTSSASIGYDSFLKRDIIPFVLLLKDDKVPNVRFNIVQMLKSIILFLKEKESSPNNDNIYKIKNVINSFTTDEDNDVKFFASEAMKIFTHL